MEQNCRRCGRGRPPRDVERLAWVHEPGDGRSRWLCPQCAREHTRDIEAKLPDEWW